MEELIKEAERLYKQIDDIQIGLVKSRLDVCEEEKMKAISEMETTMCAVFQFLKCIIERKDNIVDLGVVWHTQDDEPEKLRQIVAEKIDGNSIGGYYEEDGYNELACKFVPQGIYRDVMLIDGQWKKVDFISNWDEIKRWAYLEDLLPKGGEEWSITK